MLLYNIADLSHNTTMSETPTTAAGQMAMAKAYGAAQAQVNANTLGTLTDAAKGAATMSSITTLAAGGIAGLASGIPGAFASIYNTNQQIAFQDKWMNRDWDAARSIGLASPAQFGSTSADMAIRRFASSVRSARSPTGSAYSV